MIHPNTGESNIWAKASDATTSPYLNRVVLGSNWRREEGGYWIILLQITATR